jgi:hypothetical protein
MLKMIIKMAMKFFILLIEEKIQKIAFGPQIFQRVFE